MAALGWSRKSICYPVKMASWSSASHEDGPGAADVVNMDAGDILGVMLEIQAMLYIKVDSRMHTNLRSNSKPSN